MSVVPTIDIITSLTKNGVVKYFFPENYGAKGDGVTDDTAAMLATINAANGNPIYLRNRYVCKDLFIFDQPVHMVGPGTFVSSLGATVMKVQRSLGTAQNITAISTTQIGPDSPTGNNAALIFTKLSCATANVYQMDDIIHLSSQDPYPWSTQVSTENGYTLYIYQADILTCAGIGLDYTGLANGGFAQGDVVTGATSGATATVKNSGNNGKATDTVIFTKVTGTFQNGENLTVASTVRGVASGVTHILVVQPIIDTYNMGSVPKVRKMTNSRFVMDGVSLECSGDPNSIVAVANRQIAFWLRGCVNPVVKNFTVRSSWSRAWRVESCYQPTVSVYIEELPNNANLSEGAYGYGIEFNGATYGGVAQVNGGNCRHGFTTNVDWITQAQIDSGFDYSTFDKLRTGTIKWNVVRDSSIKNSRDAAFDTHSGDYYTTFINCVSTHPSGVMLAVTQPNGFKTRGFGTRYKNCVAYGGAIGFVDQGGVYNAGFQHETTYENCNAIDFLGYGFFISQQPYDRTQHRNVWRGCLARGNGVSFQAPYSQAGWDGVTGNDFYLENCRAEKFGTLPFMVKSNQLWYVKGFVADYREANSQASEARVESIPFGVFLDDYKVIRHPSVFNPVAVFRNNCGSLVTIDMKNCGCIDANIPLIRNTNGSTTTIQYKEDSNIVNLGTAAPSTGTWAVGDKIKNSTPTAGGYMGFVCTTAGTPGTWKGYGAIAP